MICCKCSDLLNSVKTIVKNIFTAVSIGTNIKKYRDLRGWEQEKLASETGFTKQNISQWENDRHEPSKEKLDRLAKALGVKTSDFYSDVEDEKLTSVNNSHKPKETATRKVPLYDAIAVGGNSMLADQSPISEPIDMVDPGDLLRSATALLVVRGQSMFPKYPSGCYVAFKRGGEKIPAVIVWGEDYVIELEDRRILKRVEKGETKDHIKAVSYNINKDNKYMYDPIDIHRNDVKRMYMVLGKVELEASI